MLNPLIWINAANVLYLASYSVRDILWLRILTVIGALLLIPYYLLQPAPLMAAIGWSTVFIAINAYWIVRLIVERRPVHLTPDEERLRKLSFPSLTAREALNLFGLGAWEDIPSGGSIVKHDLDQKRFSVILRGMADVQSSGKTIAELGDGQFVGVIDLCADRVPIDVIVRQPAHIMCWPVQTLKTFLADRPDVALALQRSIGLELQRMLGTTLADLDSI
jgi:Popeye protein conserved region